MTMTATLSFQSPYPRAETRQILDDALSIEREFARVRLMKFTQECQEFEAAYQMASTEFLQQFESGQLGDDPQWFDWFAATRGKQVWERKYLLLKGLSWNE